MCIFGKVLPFCWISKISDTGGGKKRELLGLVMIESI